MFRKVHIRKHERGLLFERGDFKRLLEPGTHYIWSNPLRPRKAVVQVYDTLETLFEHPLKEVLAVEPDLQKCLLVVDLNDRQRALVWRNDRLAFFLGPGRFALWKMPYELKVETFDVDDFRFTHPRLDAILAHPGASVWVDVVDIDPHSEVLVFRNGDLVDGPAHGRQVFWKMAGRVVYKVIDRREQTADVAGQEIMTNDKVTLRVNLLVTYQVVDSVKAVTVVADHAQSLYREAQLALRAAIGTRPLDALLADKEAVGSEVREALAKRAAEFGIAVRGVGLKDIILPGEMKAILNQVIEAEKQAQANLIKRREETAAARSQANTARLLAENPILARMKELELLQEILAGTKATFVFGDGDIAQRIRALVASGPREKDPDG